MRAHEFVFEKRKIPFAGAKASHKEGPAGQWRNKGSSANRPAKVGDLVGGESIDNDIDEGWKDWVAGAAIGAAALGGSGDAEAAKKKPVEKPSIVQQVSKQDIAKTVTGNPHEVVLKKAAEKAGIQGQELAAFLSQCAHETMDFKHMKEIGGKLDFKKYDPRFAPRKAKTLGNTTAGDGAKYKGRGYIQLTGKYNYAAASKAIYGDDRLVKDPSLVEKPDVAAKTSVWFWQNRVQDKVKNFTNVKDVTKGINPGLKHLDQRQDKFNTFQIAMR
jgi:putative chitinase